jgi:hypothetical protein
MYDLVERWGVRYELHSDLIPDSPGKFRLPEKAIVCEPDLRWRAYRTYNDFPNNECIWAAADYTPLIDQLAKPRMNGIIVICRPHDPFFEFEFHGARGMPCRLKINYTAFDEPSSNVCSNSRSRGTRCLTARSCGSATAPSSKDRASNVESLRGAAHQRFSAVRVLTAMMVPAPRRGLGRARSRIVATCLPAREPGNASKM